MTNSWGRRPLVVAAALLVTTFGAGAAAGIAADHWIAPRPAAITRVTHDFSGVLDALELTADQRRRAETLLTASAPRSEAILRQVAQQLRMVADSVDAELRTILTPLQRARLDSLRRGPLFVIKRKLPAGTTTVDTLLRPDTTR